jgi:hypothetical protein
MFDDGMIDIGWTETRTRKCTVRLTPDEARERFGLGGTPDELLPVRIVALAGYSHQVLGALDSMAKDEEFTGHKLELVNGLPPGDF